MKFDIHHHLRMRMQQRGVTINEIAKTVSEGRPARDVKEGTLGRVLVFPYNECWEGKYFEEKEVTVYYKVKDDKLIVLTAKARYGKDFLRGGKGK